jgi:hypothetical protein
LNNLLGSYEQQPQQLQQQSEQQQQAAKHPRRTVGNPGIKLQLPAHKGYSGSAVSAIVMTQVFRLLLALCTGPAAAEQAGGSCLRDQLLFEVKAAAEAAAAEAPGLHGNKHIGAMTVVKHLAPARIQQLRAATNQRPHNSSSSRRTSSSDSSGSSSDASTSSSDARVVARARLLPPCDAQAPFWSPQQQQEPQQQQQGPAAARPASPVCLVPQAPIWDVSCLLETTLVAAAAEAQLNFISLEDPGSDCLMDDACSAVDIESVMLEEFELALHGAV